MSDVALAETQPQPSPWKEFTTTLGAVLTLVGGGVLVVNLLVGPVQARVDKLETQQHEYGRDQQQLIERTTRVETKLDQALSLLRKGSHR